MTWGRFEKAKEAFSSLEASTNGMWSLSHNLSLPPKAEYKAASAKMKRI